jgi:hypothetical protein
MMTPMKKTMTQMKDFLWVAGVCCLLVGCSPPLRTLVDLSAEQKNQRAFVKKEDARFKVLLDDIRYGRLKIGTTLRSQVVARYGEPVLEEDRTLLYRRPVEFFNASKVYLDFDEAGRLAAIKSVEEK